MAGHTERAAEETGEETAPMRAWVVEQPDAALADLAGGRLTGAAVLVP